MEIGEKIKRYRKERKLSQRRLSEISNVAENTINQYENGKRQPRIEQLQKIASALNIGITSLLPASDKLICKIAKQSELPTRIEPDIKEKAETILNELGISTAEAINMFFRQVIRYRGIPLDLRIPNAETIAAIEEVELGVDLYQCDNLEQLFYKLKED